MKEPHRSLKLQRDRDKNGRKVLKGTETGLTIIAVYPALDNLFYDSLAEEAFFVRQTERNHQQILFLSSPHSPVIFRNEAIVNARCLNETFAHTRQIQVLGEVICYLAFFFNLVHFIFSPLFTVRR